LNTVVQSSYPDWRIVVVDNGSTDDSVRRIQETFPGIRLLCNEANLGYAEGNNIGIRYALASGAAYLLLLNDDVRMEDDTLSHMVAAAEDPEVAAVGCRIRAYEAPERLWAAGECFPRGEALPLDGARFDEAREIDYAPGCCLLMCRRAIEDVGLLEADFFFMHEDLDWCYRARDAGYRIRYAPDAVAYHKLSVSTTGRSGALFHYFYARNWLLFWERRGIIPQDWRRLRGVALVWYNELGLIMRYGQSKLSRAWWMTRGVLDYVGGRFGPPPADIWELSEQEPAH
jgi:hypothetical protein